MRAIPSHDLSLDRRIIFHGFRVKDEIFYPECCSFRDLLCCTVVVNNPTHFLLYIITKILQGNVVLKIEVI